MSALRKAPFVAFVPALVLALTRCDFTAFSTYLPRAQTAVFTAPDGYRAPEFGSTLAALPVPLPSIASATRAHFVVSSGVGSSVALYAVDLTRVPESAPAPLGYVCNREAPCTDLRLGDPLAGVARWGAGAACALASSFSDRSVSVRVTCAASEPFVRAEVRAPSEAAQTMGFGRVLAGSPDDEGGLFFAGAPFGGRVFIVRDTGPIAELAGPAISMGAGPETYFGEALAVARARLSAASPATERALWLFVGAPGAGAVYAHVGDPLRGIAFSAVACAPGGGGPGFGGVLTAGDFDGDGLADVAVGVKRGVRDRGASVRVFFGARAPATSGGAAPSCETAPWPGVAISCAAGDDVRCEDSDFGSALAAADLDADGRDELLVGAPNATVAGAARAGAVLVARIDPATGGAARWAYLRSATPQEGDELGGSLAVLRADGRYEPLVGSRRAGVRVFACSGLEGDRPNEAGLDDRCRPRR